MPATPFEVGFPETALQDLWDRIARVRWPNAPADAGWDYGADTDYVRDLVAYWRDGYDWRAAEARLNRFPQYLVPVDGRDVHIVHERGSGSNPLPIVITHGWPGSVFEFVDVIDPLAHPERFGGDPEDGFDVIVPSLPGYGFSAAPPKPIDQRAVAAIWRKLMVDELGYGRFVAQGGDWGSLVTSWLGRDHADVVAAIHLNMLILRPRLDDTQPPLDESETTWAKRARARQAAEGGYQRIQATKPQSLAYGLTDSPVGLAAWIVEKFHRWGDTGGDVESRFSKDRLLDHITLYWLTGCINTANWMYRAIVESDNFHLPAGERIEVPTGIANFPGDIFEMPPRRWVERVCNVRHWTDMPAGGHFAAMEEPDLFVRDLRSFFSAFREAAD